MSQSTQIATPVERALRTTDASAPWSSPSIAFPTRVLIVEDDPGDVYLIREALVDDSDRLMEVHTVDRVSSAVDELSHARFDCVLLDLGLPDSTALDGLSRILESQQGIAVIVVTGREDHQLGLEAVRLGAQDYLTKHESFGRQLHHVVGYSVERARALLRERRLALLLDRTSQVVLVIDAHMQVSYASASIATMLGCEVDDVIGADVSAVIDPDDMPSVREQVGRALRDPDGLRSPIAVRATHANGEVRWYEVSVDNLLHDAAIDGLIVNARDITERKHAEFEIERMAFHDALTGLPSRTRLTTLLAEALQRSDGHGNSVAIAVLDLDHFKAINDSLGHATGDALLIAVAQRIASALRHPETLARFGGDEFAILTEGALGSETCADLGDRLGAAMEAPISIDTGDFRISITGGLAMSRVDSTADTLVRDADTALYHAKEEHRGRLALFDERLESRTRRRLDVEIELRAAMELGQLHVHYQPVVDLLTQSTVGFEALLRWTHPELGTISPDEFIPIAEETGLIIPIGHWVLEQSLERIGAWRRRSAETSQIWVAVNLSGRQLEQLHLVDRVADALQASDVPAQALHLEVTESVLMDNIDQTLESMNRLRSLGISMSIDDFGTGYSSLSYLKQLPIDTLKIDRSFIAGLGTDPDDTLIVSAVVSLAKALHMSVLAEGVEEQTQLDALIGLGCDQGQGYQWSAALAPRDASTWIGVRDPD